MRIWASTCSLATLAQMGSWMRTTWTRLVLWTLWLLPRTSRAGPYTPHCHMLQDARKSLGQALKRTGGDELLAELPVRSTLAAEANTTHHLQTMHCSCSSSGQRPICSAGLFLYPLVLQAADRSEGRGSAAPRAPDGRPMLDFYDEPTAPEDQEEVQENDPQQQPLPSAAAPG